MSSYAVLQWDKQGLPSSRQFGDVYFSKENGLAETDHVFIESQGLPARWQVADFHIAELGFGTGLNFLRTWQRWETDAPAGAVLRFSSVERYPVKPEDLAKALKLWPMLKEYSSLLMNKYQPYGIENYTFTLSNGRRVELRVYWQEAAEALPNIADQDVDAWYLDGFAPKANPQLWTPEICNHIGRTTKLNGTLATFTAARAVKDRLAEAGFAMEKIAGYGRKREMLVGRR